MKKNRQDRFQLIVGCILLLAAGCGCYNRLFYGQLPAEAGVVSVQEQQSWALWTSVGALLLGLGFWVVLQREKDVLPALYRAEVVLMAAFVMPSVAVDSITKICALSGLQITQAQVNEIYRYSMIALIYMAFFSIFFTWLYREREDIGTARAIVRRYSKSGRLRRQSAPVWVRIVTHILGILGTVMLLFLNISAPWNYLFQGVGLLLFYCVTQMFAPDSGIKRSADTV